MTPMAAPDLAVPPWVPTFGARTASLPLIHRRQRARSQMTKAQGPAQPPLRPAPKSRKRRGLTYPTSKICPSCRQGMGLVAGSSMSG
jgi:hypothetical protein